MDGLFDFVTNLINKEGLVGGIVGALLIVFIAGALLVIRASVKRRNADHESDIEISGKIAEQYLGRREKDEKYFDDYIQTFKGQITSLETNLTAAETRYNEAEARHVTETKVMRGEIDSLKTLRERDAARARQQAATIKEQSQEIDNYRVIYQEHSKEIKELKQWKHKIEIFLGPWADRIIKGLSPSDVEEFEEILSGFADAVGGNDDD